MQKHSISIIIIKNFPTSITVNQHKNGQPDD